MFTLFALRAAEPLYRKDTVTLLVSGGWITVAKYVGRNRAHNSQPYNVQLV
jgi:hypothetical protein